MSTNSSKTIQTWLKQSSIALKSADILSANLDSLILLEHVLGVDRANLLAHPEQKLTSPQLTTLDSLLSRRIEREPIAYITGKIEFYGYEFKIDSHALVPRPESESFINILKSMDVGTKDINLLDLGCGSGVLGLTSKLVLRDIKIYLADTSEPALRLAKENAAKHKLSARFIRSNLLTNLDNSFDIILANLPYVPTGYTVSKELSYEPKAALYSGADGLDLYRTFWHQVSKLSSRPKFIMTEGLISQHEPLTKLAGAAGYKLEQTEGLVQSFKLS